MIMEILEQWMYGDPANVIDRIESRTCKGCIFEEVVFGEKYCGKGQRYGRRCKQYMCDDGKAV